MKKATITPEHFRDLQKGHCVFLFPSHVHKMISGVARIQQNQKGLITLTYENGQKKSVQMGDMNLAKQDNFLEAFRAIWRRMETGI